MDPFTPLDVIRYEQTCSLSPGVSIYHVMNKIIRNTHSLEMQKQFKNVGAVLQNSINFTAAAPINKELFIFDFKIVEKVWEEKEWQWYITIFNENLTYKSSFISCWIPVYRLCNPRELFYLFTEILRIKFSYDDNLMCILDDLLKRIV